MVGTASLSSCFPPRHSRFGGSYVLQGLKSIGDRDVVFHKGLHNVSVGPGRWQGARGQGCVWDTVLGCGTGWRDEDVVGAAGMWRGANEGRGKG